MLQLIGWLGCLYLLVKGLEIASSNSYTNEHGRMRLVARVASLLGIVGAVLFALMFLSHGFSGPAPETFGNGEPAPSEFTGPVNDCTAKAQTDEEMRACNK